MATDTPVSRSDVGVASQYTEEEIRRGLLTVAICGGNTERAAATLKEQGLEIPGRTLRHWRNDRHAELYRELHRTHGQDIEAALVPELRELAIRATQVGQEAVELAAKQIKSGDIKDPAGTARNLATTGAVAMDKLYLATDRPTEIRHNLTADELLDRLEQRSPKAIDSTAVEIGETEAEQSEAQPQARSLPRVSS